jgi:uncharacterized membrane protein (DUF4010 family)
MDSISTFSAHVPGVLVGLTIGLLIGAEREWSQRLEKTERVVAGIRTFGLLGLLGSLSVALMDILGPTAWVVLALVVALLIVTGYVAQARITQDWGMTTEFALLITFVLGSMAGSGSPVMAGALAVIVAALLSLKNVLHTQVHRLRPNEVSGALKLLFISVVMLPLLPNQTFGPFNIVNPYVLWWMVVLITGLGFAAYVTIRVVGERSGLLLTSALGGMVSSTAMTVTLSRLAASISQPNTISAGLLLSAGLMFPRVIIVCGILAPTLISVLALPLVIATLIYLCGAAWYAYKGTTTQARPSQALDSDLQNPFDIVSALKFTALLIAIMFAVEIARLYLGDTGLYAMAAISGAADVDAVSLSLSRMAQVQLGLEVAGRGILIAAFSNSLVKLCIAGSVAGWSIFKRIAPFVFLAAICVLLIVW